MKTRLLLLPLLFLASCASIQSGNDPVLVRAESVTKTAFDTFDSFFALERMQEVYVKAHLPAAHKFANILRANAPKFLATARSTTESYRLNRTAENKATLNTAIAVLQTALAQVSAYTVQITEKAP